MKEKINDWIKANKRDAKILLAIFAIAFILYLFITRDIVNALGAGFGWFIFGAVAINAFRYWRKWSGKLFK